LEIAATPLEAAHRCGDALVNAVAAAVAERGSANIAVSGGTTPKLLFEYLASRTREQSLDWSRVHLFWVDERSVPPGDPQSNYTLAATYWLDQCDFPAANVHRIEAELPVADAASRYAAMVRSHFGIGDAGLPVFDVILQGMGGDAHTASLFPGEPLIHDHSGVACAVYVEKLKAARVTLLPGVLKQARKTYLLVTGADKVDALHAAMNGPEDLSVYPIQLTRHHAGEVTWFLDEAAAARVR
jgi:6-phosphogluconolactonase